MLFAAEWDIIAKYLEGLVCVPYSISGSDFISADISSRMRIDTDAANYLKELDEAVMLAYLTTQTYRSPPFLSCPLDMISTMLSRKLTKKSDTSKCRIICAIISHLMSSQCSSFLCSFAEPKFAPVLKLLR